MNNNPLLDDIDAMLAKAEKLAADIEDQGQYVASCAFDDVLHGLRKTRGVWNHSIPYTQPE